MTKVLLEKKVRKAPPAVIDNSNNEDKYFKADDESDAEG